MKMHTSLLLSISVLVSLSVSAPVIEHRILKLQPVPRNFLDWPAFARRQVLTSMDHQVVFPAVTADDDIRHLINAPEDNEAVDESDSSLPGVVIPEESSSYFSSSFSSSKMGDSPENWLSYRQIYNYLPGLREPQQEESSSSIVSWASLENSYNASETAETDEQ